MTLSASSLIVLIPASAAVPGRGGEVGMGLRGHTDSSLGRTKGWAITLHRVGTPYSKGSVAGLASVLHK